LQKFGKKKQKELDNSGKKMYVSYLKQKTKEKRQ